MSELQKIIENLKTKSEVDAVFLTGSHGISVSTPHSDIDLVIILKENFFKVDSLYTWIDTIFADIFFFDRSDLERIQSATELPANAMDAILLSWIEKASIQFDVSGKVSSLKSNVAELKKKVSIPEDEKQTFARKINYNWVANKRYFESGQKLYHEALEMRLLYSVSEIISGFFVFRDIPWRGEKAAVTYLTENTPNFYVCFSRYTKATSLSEKYHAYFEIVKTVFPTENALWMIGDVFPQFKEKDITHDVELRKWWESITL